MISPIPEKMIAVINEKGTSLVIPNITKYNMDDNNPNEGLLIYFFTPLKSINLASFLI